MTRCHQSAIKKGLVLGYKVASRLHALGAGGRVSGNGWKEESGGNRRDGRIGARRGAPENE